jgi:hypothetical protein
MILTGVIVITPIITTGVTTEVTGITTATIAGDPPTIGAPGLRSI